MSARPSIWRSGPEKNTGTGSDPFDRRFEVTLWSSGRAEPESFAVRSWSCCDHDRLVVADPCCPHCCFEDLRVGERMSSARANARGSQCRVHVHQVPDAVGDHVQLPGCDRGVGGHPGVDLPGRGAVVGARGVGLFHGFLPVGDLLSLGLTDDPGHVRERDDLRTRHAVRCFPRKATTPLRRGRAADQRGRTQ